MEEKVTGRRQKARHAPLEVDVELVAWGPKGSTWADVDGRRVPVDRGIPEERVRAVVRRTRGSWQGTVQEVVSPSPVRVAAPCPYYRLGCGGCQWQHVAHEAQLEIKRDLVRRELDTAGVAAPIDEVHGMADPWRYRRTAAIALGWEAGFRPRGRRGIVEIHDCLISHPAIGCLASELNEVLRRGALPRYHGKVWLDCTVIDGGSGPGVQVVIQGIRGLTLEDNPDLPDVASVIARLPEVASVAFRHRKGEVIPLHGALVGTVHVAGVPLRVPAGAFFQTNVQMLEKLVARMRGLLGGRAIGHGADIFGGVGTFAFSLADRLERVTLIELDAQAVAAAAETAESLGTANIDLVSDHAEHALATIGPVDVAIVDPPRSGLGPTVVDSLAAQPVPEIFYVSCAPASLARDLAHFLARGYRVCSLELFDFYPQTFHVEALAVLRR